MRQRAAGFLAGLVVCLVAACATVPAPPHDAGTTFYTRGRVSIHYQDFASGKEDTVFGRFDWTERGQTVDLSLLDPLGQSIAAVHAEPGAATLTLSDGRIFQGTSADDLTREALGYTLPISGLRSWLIGHPADPSVAPKTNADGAVVIQEMNWTVKYPDASLPPKRIDLSYPGPGVALELRLAIETTDVP